MATLHVAWNADGFLAATLAGEAGLKVLLGAYPDAPWVVSAFPVAESADSTELADGAELYLLEYVGCGAPALVTASRAEWEAECKRLGAVDAVYDGEVEYWTRRLGEVPSPAADRLGALQRLADRKCEGKDLPEDLTLRAAYDAIIARRQKAPGDGAADPAGGAPGDVGPSGGSAPGSAEEAAAPGEADAPEEADA